MASKNPAKAPVRSWSQHVTERSRALVLENGVFSLTDPKEIAASLKRSAEASKRRKANPFRSAMSMLVFKTLSEADRARRRGFIDQRYVPSFDQFPMSQNLEEANFLFWVNVNRVLGKKTVKRSSLRAYRDWNAPVDQIALSLKRTLDGRTAPR
jgi:hypothetical protein